MLDKYFIIRTSWVFGKNGKNFVSSILKLARENNELAVVTDQVGSPTYTSDLAQAIIELIKNNRFGTYHLTNSNYCSWYQFTTDILRLSGNTDIEIKPINLAQLKRIAHRPAYTVLENRN